MSFETSRMPNDGELPHPSAQKVMGTLSSLLQPVFGMTNVMRRVVEQQQFIQRDIESLHDDLQNAQMHFDAANEAQRRQLDAYCARVARCRSDVAVLLRRLNAIAQRLTLVHRVVLQRTMEHDSKKMESGGQQCTSSALPHHSLAAATAADNTDTSGQPSDKSEVSGKTSDFPEGADAMLIVDGIIDLIAGTEEVMTIYTAMVQQISPSVILSHMGGRVRPPGARIIDCQGKYFVGPGFIDSHVHFLDGGRHLSSPCMEFAQSKDQFVAILQKYYHEKYVVGGRDPDGWIFGGGWSETVLGTLPSRYWLDEVSTTVPIILYSKDMHSAVYNTAALVRCCIISESGDFTDVAQKKWGVANGGIIEWDPMLHGPTGVLRDNAILATRDYWPSQDSEEGMMEALNSASHYFLQRGFTMVFSMTSLRFDNLSEIEFLTRMEKAGKLRLRVRCAVRPQEIQRLMSDYYSPLSQTQRRDGLTLPFRFSFLPEKDGGGFLLLGAVKFFSDGSLSSRTAAMTHPYEMEMPSDDGSDSREDDRWGGIKEEKAESCVCGVLTMTIDELTKAIAAAQQHHLQCCCHAIGDRAVGTVNRLFANAITAQREEARRNEDADDAMQNFQLNPRYRVEHCQHVSSVSSECNRMSKHGIIASMQPCHLLFDGDYIDSLLGESRKNRSYVWKSFIKGEVHVAFGSDWMVAAADIMDGLRASVVRVPKRMAVTAAEKITNDSQTESRVCDNPHHGMHPVWNAKECLTLDEALRAYTHEGAYAAFMEPYVGSLEVGKWADVTVFSDDLLDESRMQPSPVAGGRPWWPQGREPQVMYTIVGGVVEYERSSTEVVP